MESPKVPLLGSTFSNDTNSEFSDDRFDDEPMEAIAIIGMAMKFPGEAVNTKSFWSTLMQGRNVSTHIPETRMNASSFYHPDKSRSDTIQVRGGHFLTENIAAFDAPFFSISAAEAAALDPQQRLLLEVSYRAIENAGLPLNKISGSKTSVYSACFTDDYRGINSRDPEYSSSYAVNGLALNMLANRLSWFYNLLGPSINVDSACSSSLMAFDMACQGLRARDADMSIVSGCNLIFNVDWMFLLNKMGFLSPDGKCFSFDHRANGYARGEGIGVVILKRLADAVRDGDVIRAVVRSTGSNCDGRTAPITQPSRDSQAILIRDTYAKAGLDMSLTRFVEAHGTGTPIGDPIECGALGDCFRQYRSSDEPLLVGALKSNVGHLEGASGIAGIIKTVLVLETGLIPPNANFERCNPNIDTKFLNIKFPIEPTPWPQNGLRRASINSFGFGGSNSHAVLDDAHYYLHDRNIIAKHWTVSCPKLPSSHLETPGVKFRDSAISTPELGPQPEGVEEHEMPVILSWSAPNERTLEIVTSQHQVYFSQLHPRKTQEAITIQNFSHTLNAKRTQFPWRTCAIASSFSQLHELGTLLSKPQKATLGRKLGFVFTGQGAQWYAMSRELLVYPMFMSSLVRSNACFQACGCEWSLLEELLKDESSSRINRPEFSQPICTAVQIALVDLLRSFNVHPTAVIGHSSGDIAAAYAVGAISARSACQIAYYRGSLAQKLASMPLGQQGAMIAVGLSDAEVQYYLNRMTALSGKNTLTAACLNSPTSTTVSGTKQQVLALKELLDQDGVFARILNVSVAYHSPMMNNIAADYLNLLQDLEPGIQGSPWPVQMLSSVTGSVATATDLCRGEYWVANMLSPVQFTKAVGRVRHNDGKARKKLNGSHRNFADLNDLIEIGPHAALQGPIRDILASLGNREITYSSVLERKKDAILTTSTAMAKLYCLGYAVDIDCVNNLKGSSRLKTVVDLPEYPFDHTKTYWAESRLCKGVRFRHTPKNDLLGAPVADWNPREARWRNFIGTSNFPWIADHKIDNTTLYPAAGMLVMAIEGAKQLADNPQDIVAFNIKDAVFCAPINIPPTNEGVETQTYLQPLTTSSGKGSSWYQFIISIFEGQWTEVCRGKIKSECRNKHTEVDDSKEEKLKLEKYKRLFEQARVSYARKVDSEAFYQRLEDCGYQYGPSFRRLQGISSDNGSNAIAQGTTYKEDSAPVYAHACTVHPATLDSLLHLVFVALTNGMEAPLDTMIPTRVDRMWISGTGIDRTNEILNIKASSSHQSSRTSLGAITVLDEELKSLLFDAHGVQMTKIASTSASTDGSEPAKQLVCGVNWRVDVDLLTIDQTLAFCHGDINHGSEPKEYFEDVHLLMNLAISKVLSSPNLDIQTLKPHLRKYLDWCHLNLQKFHLQASQPDLARFQDLLSHKFLFNAVCERIRRTNSQGALYAEVISKLNGIINGDFDMLALLFSGSLAKDFYDDVNESIKCYDELSRYIDALAHKNPSMRILEVGAGTGSSTKMVLKSLMSENNERRYGSYDFTDISASFFERGRKEYTDHSRMEFKTMNIEDDPIQHGFESSSYDLIIAANVLHATHDITLTMKNIRKLLKPGGRLVLFEVTRPDQLRSGFVWGLLPGWWLSVEGFRDSGPCLTTQKWDSILRDNGFSGNDVVLDDYESEKLQLCSIIISTAVEEVETLSLPPLVLVLAESPSEVAKEMALGLQFQLSTFKGQNCQIMTLKELNYMPADDQKYFIIFLVELDQSLLYQLNPRTFNLLKNHLHSASGVLWVGNRLTPDHGWTEGLFRVLQTENPGVRYVTLALQDSEEVKHNTTIVTNVLTTTLRASIHDYEAKYTEVEGILQIPRVVESRILNQEIYEKSLAVRSGPMVFGECPPMEMQIKSAGLLDTLHFTNDSRHGFAFDEESVEIEVKAIGMNFMDCLVALGRISDDTFGTECAGVIRRAGSSSGFQAGDRVCGNMLNTYRTFARSKGHTIRIIPDEMSFAEAASLPTTFGTAYHALYNIARVESGETILIHAGAGGTGQAAIQIAKILGAEIFTTTSSEEKRSLLISRYGIPEDHIFYSRDMSFAEGIKRMTNNEGVDVVLNSLSGDGLVATWECIKAYGRFVEIGKKDIHERGTLPMFPFAKNVTFSAIDYAAMIAQRPALVGNILARVLTMFKQVRLQTAYPLVKYCISEVERAFRVMQSGKNVGKTVIEIDEKCIVPTTLNARPNYTFAANATYVISGGLGGLGRKIASWMVLNGARHLILLSRSGVKSPEAQALMVEMRDQGVQVAAPACDITLASTLKKCIDDYSLIMPRVKGCIQASMVVKDSLFSNMSHGDWQSSTSPKISGSWNLHTLLPSGMDFFILLSSITGMIGQGGQSNYAAGNTYQDSLSYRRTSLGQKSISIDLGVMATTGWLKLEENKHLMDRWLSSEIYTPLNISQLLALLEHYCDPSLPLQTYETCQVVIGLEIPANLEAKGVERGTWMDRTLFRGMKQIPCSLPTSDLRNQSTTITTEVDPKSLFVAASSTSEASEVVASALCAKLAKSLALPGGVEDIDPSKPLHNYGVDSLLAVELRSWLMDKFQADVPVFEILAGNSAIGVGLAVAGRSKMLKLDG